MRAPPAPPITAPMMAPSAVLPVALPMSPPMTAPAAAPMPPPFTVLLAPHPMNMIELQRRRMMAPTTVLFFIPDSIRLVICEPPRSGCGQPAPPGWGNLSLKILKQSLTRNSLLDHRVAFPDRNGLILK